MASRSSSGFDFVTRYHTVFRENASDDLSAHRARSRRPFTFFQFPSEDGGSSLNELEGLGFRDRGRDGGYVQYHQGGIQLPLNLAHIFPLDISDIG